ALFFSPGQQQRSPLAEKLGCDIDDEGCVKCSKKTATDVPGVFVAGSASTGLQLVIIAAAEGTEAAFAINQALLYIETARHGVRSDRRGAPAAPHPCASSSFISSLALKRASWSASSTPSSTSFSATVVSSSRTPSGTALPAAVSGVSHAVRFSSSPTSGATGAEAVV